MLTTGQITDKGKMMIRGQFPTIGQNADYRPNYRQGQNADYRLIPDLGDKGRLQCREAKGRPDYGQIPDYGQYSVEGNYRIAIMKAVRMRTPIIVLSVAVTLG